jgi:hypothetical protein
VGGRFVKLNKGKMVEPVLIKNQTKEQVNGRDSDLQEANAKLLAELRLKQNSANNYLYMVKVEDPTIKSKCRYFVALKLREDNAFCLDLVGVEINSKDKDTFKSYNEVVNYVKNGESVHVVNIRFPWTRVINIENRTYVRK